MKETGRFLFLGTGASMGVPVIACKCEVCQSNLPFNQRLRPGGLLKVKGKKILVDCGPEIRIQALRYKIDYIDGVILTHSHYDHIAGVDDLRAFHLVNRQPLPCLLSSPTAKDLQLRYYYMFEKNPVTHKLVSNLSLQILEGERGEATFLDIPFRYVTFYQAGMAVNGFCIGNMAFLSDIREYPETLFQDLQGIEILIISALRFTPSHLHFTVDEAVEFSQKIGAKKTWLTHISHDLDHEKTNAYLPPNIRMAYDGLEVDFEL